MWRIETRRELSEVDFRLALGLIHLTQAHNGFPPLSDHLLIDLANRGGHGFAALNAIDERGHFVAYAQLSRAHDSTVIELVVDPTIREPFESLATELLRAAFDVVSADGGGRVTWWVHHPDDSADAIAAATGMTLGRRLLQMRRDLPLTDTTEVETRAFIVGSDEQEWLRVNNAAFHDHPEQGGWTIETLRQREAEPWFDAEGFRLHERDGMLAAFCWTKVHSDTLPPMGEIYVIAVDPPFHGHGLGKALTIAGLQHLAEHGLAVGMLHVDGANTGALALYERLGFTVHHSDHAYVADISTNYGTT